MRVSRLLVSGAIGILVLAGCNTNPTRSGGGGALDNSAWSLQRLDGQAPLQDARPTLRFDDGRVEGSDGCNSFSGSYTAGGGRLRIDDDLVQTRRGCAPWVMEQAQEYVQALRRARRHEVSGDSLSLHDDAGRRLAVFVRQRASRLRDSSWVVSAYNNGREAVTSVVGGTTLTLAFESDGRLAGSSGCNDFRGSYTVDGGRLRLGPVASARRHCAQPPGTMEQERRYVDALESVASYRIDGDRLELRTAGGALAVVARSSAAAEAAADDMYAIPMRCGERRIRVEPGLQSARLTVDGESFFMRQVAAASGTQYVAENDPYTRFWSRGDRATLELRGRRLPECVRLDAARY